MIFEEKMINSQLIFNGKIIKVYIDDILLPDGKPAKREVVSHNGGCCILAVTDNDEILLVKQFRYPYGEEIYEIPAGKLDIGENPEICAMRELKEETGYDADSINFLCEIYPTPGYANEKIYIYCASGLKSGEMKLDEDEFLNFEKIPISKVKEMIENNEIKDAKTIIAVLRYLVAKG